MRRNFLPIVTFAFLLPVTSMGQIQSPKTNRHNHPQKLFQLADKNGDGQISRDEWQRRPRAFDRLDQNHDGFISREEAANAARGRAERRRRFPDKAIRKLDKNNDGQISRDEWTRNSKAFDRFDKNHDGVITREELSERPRHGKSSTTENTETPVVKPPRI